MKAFVTNVMKRFTERDAQVGIALNITTKFQNYLEPMFLHKNEPERVSFSKKSEIIDH